jgi:hypothetical protein
MGRIGVLGAVVMLGCSVDSDAPVESTATASHWLQTNFETFISGSIEIDDDPANQGDANLFVGNDPADGSPSFQLPTGGPLPFIDWNDLDPANHQLLDLNNAQGRDESSFPRSNECVASSNVLSKMAITYAAVANNNQYVYLAVQRSNNNGDAGWYFLFTEKSPSLAPGAGPCRANEEQLTYDISGPVGGATGDVLFAGHFKPSEGPLVRVFKAVASRDNVTAVDALNFNDNTLWVEDPSGIAASAVNTTPTDAGGLGAAQVEAASGNIVAPEIFTEVAVPLSVFTGGNPCGATFFGSVISRSSGAGGTTPDLKDLAGPAVFNFGDAVATAALTPTCGFEVGFTASATAPDGTAIPDAECTWSFDDGTTSNDCNGTIPLTQGHRTATVTVTDPETNCSDTVTAAVDVLPPLEVTADTTDTCELQFGFSSTLTGGSPDVTYSWNFSGPGTTTPTSLDQPNGSVQVSVAGPYTAALTVTDNRKDVSGCHDSAMATANPLAPLAIHLQLKAAPETCPAMATDAVTYDAIISGGDGAYQVTWTGQSCSGLTCEINPDESDFCANATLSATVDDGSPLCPFAGSEVETYSKITQITVSDN